MTRIVPLLIFLWATTASASELTLYFIKAPKPISWSSPSRLAQTAVRNSIFHNDHGISHTFVELQCTNENEEVIYQKKSGMTSDSNMEQIKLLLGKGYGLGVMLHNAKGRLQTEAEINKDIKKYSEKSPSRMSFLKIKINDQTCLRLKQYHEEYLQLGLDKIYGGLNSRPLQKEGAGCAAYSMSYLLVADLMTEQMAENWSRILLAPTKYVGGPWTGKRVPIGKLLFNLKPTRWAEEDEAHILVEAWDPESMANWVNKKYLDPNMGDFERLNLKKSLGLYIDRANEPTPTGPIWMQ